MRRGLTMVQRQRNRYRRAQRGRQTRATNRIFTI